MELRFALLHRLVSEPMDFMSRVRVGYGLHRSRIHSVSFARRLSMKQFMPSRRVLMVTFLCLV